MREGIRTQPTGILSVWSGAILLAIGLSVLLLVGEWFAAVDACIANSACVPATSAASFEAFLGLMAVGVGVLVGGVTIILVQPRPTEICSSSAPGPTVPATRKPPFS
jgi:hypothetical protein